MSNMFFINKLKNIISQIKKETKQKINRETIFFDHTKFSIHPPTIYNLEAKDTKELLNPMMDVI